MGGRELRVGLMKIWHHFTKNNVVCTTCTYLRPTKSHALRMILTHFGAISHSHSCTHQNRRYLVHLHTSLRS